MNRLKKFLLGFLVFLVLVAVTSSLHFEPGPGMLIAAFIPLAYFEFLKRRDARKNPVIKTKLEPELPVGVLHQLVGVNDILNVYEDKVTIAPKTNATSIFIKGLKGTKSIPYSSITAIQLRMANPINGYIQFSVLGGIESGGGVMAAITDENTCFFVEKSNGLAQEIHDVVEAKVKAARLPASASKPSVSDEIQKLAKLNAEGVLTDEEFKAAKRNLIS